MKHAIQLRRRTSGSCGKDRGGAMAKMRAVRYANGLGSSVHVVRSGPAMNMDIHEARRNVSVFNLDNRAGVGRGLVPVDGNDFAIFRQKECLFKHQVRKDQIAAKADACSHFVTLRPN